MADQIQVRPVVRGNDTYDHSVVTFEVDDEHPNGEALIYRADRTFTVAQTARISRLLESGRLEKVTGDAAQAQASDAEEADADVEVPDADVLDNWNLTDLRALAARLGIPNATSIRRKNDAVAAILEVQGEDASAYQDEDTSTDTGEESS